MKAIYKQRLLKLAEHLEKGKLGHKKFNFTVINGDKTGVQVDRNGCGFMGCAIGECPIVFPRHWKWMGGAAMLRSFNVADLDDEVSSGFSSAEEFFGLDDSESNHLFAPDCQVPEEFGGRDLSGNATPKQVARNIRAFVAKKEQA